jgi:hypothetical protein
MMKMRYNRKGMGLRFKMIKSNLKKNRILVNSKFSLIPFTTLIFLEL